MSVKPDRRIAVVTGANRGLGFETARELAQKGIHVLMTARDEKKGKAACETLRKDGFEVDFHPLDVADAKDIDGFAAHIKKKYGRVDILVNNAGILVDEAGQDLPKQMRAIRETMETNVYGPFQLCSRLIPLMIERGYGRIVNVSSGMAQLSEMNAGWPGYRMSKSSLNVVTRMFADFSKGQGVLVNSVCPGWVKTDMGGPSAERSIPEGADTIVWLATLPDSGPTGGFFRDRKLIPW